MTVTAHIARALACAAIAAVLTAGCGSVSRSAIKGDIKGVRLRCEAGADINAPDRWGWNPLLWAIYYQHSEVAEYLLDRGADPDACTRKAYGTVPAGSTPLIIAAYYGQAGMVGLLLNHRADRNIRNSAGQTALSVAENYDYRDVIALLARGTSYQGNERRGSQGGGEARQIIFLKDGSIVAGTITAQTVETVTVRTGYATITIRKDRITEIRYK